MKTEINKDLLDHCYEQFYSEYFELLINRLTHSSMSLERDLGNTDDSENAIRLGDNMKAFKYLLNILFSGNKISENEIITTANIINNSSIYISKGYRKIGEHIADTDIPITPAKDIQTSMLQLLNEYENDWKDLDPFEREARFHVKFIHIHPFEDGNGRTSRLLLNFNLLRHRQAPVIITSDLIEYYYDFIHNNDVDGLKNLFRIQSTKENIIIDMLFDEYKMQKNEGYKTLS